MGEKAVVMILSIPKNGAKFVFTNKAQIIDRIYNICLSMILSVVNRIEKNAHKYFFVFVSTHYMTIIPFTVYNLNNSLSSDVISFCEIYPEKS